MFEDGAINVIVGWVAIDKAIEKESVERKAPVCGGRREFVTLPFAGIVKRIDGFLILIQIVVDITFIITKGSASREADGKNDRK